MLGEHPTPRALRPELPADFEAVVERAMARDADRRFESTHALGRAREQSCADDRPAASATPNLTVARYVAGAVLAVGATVPFVAPPSSPERPAEPRAAVGVGVGAATVRGTS